MNETTKSHIKDAVNSIDKAIRTGMKDSHREDLKRLMAMGDQLEKILYNPLVLTSLK